MAKKDFLFFWGGTFSQWQPSFFEIDGVEYNCCEQYMMAKKALLFNDFEALKNIMISDQPDDQKAFGRMVKGFSVEKWVKHCRKFVYDGNYAKFSQNPKMLEELMMTYNIEIVEASPEDPIWGIGLRATDPRAWDKSTWLGKNWLGEAIMQVRETLQTELSQFDYK